MSEQKLNLNQDSVLDIELGKGISKLSDQFPLITEYSQRDLLALSMIQTDDIMSDLVKFYIANKKHFKRKYAKELLQAFKYLTESSKKQSIFNKLFHMNRNQTQALF